MTVNHGIYSYIYLIKQGLAHVSGGHHLVHCPEHPHTIAG